MAGFSYRKPGINSRVPNNKTSYDGKFGVGEQLSSPYSSQFLGSSPYQRLEPNTVFDKMQTARTQYVVSAADLQSPFVSGVWNVAFDDEFQDLAYTVIPTVEDPNFSPPYSVVNVSAIQKTTTGVVGRLTFPAGLGQVGHVLTIH